MSTQKISLRTYDGSQVNSEISIRDFSKYEVFRRTAQRTGLVLAITFVTVFVPGLHFITVPLGLIIAISICIRTSNTKSLIEPGSATCPSCSQKFTIQGRPYALPSKETCDQCHREVLIEAAV